MNGQLSTDPYDALTAFALEAKAAGISPEKFRLAVVKHGLPDIVADELIVDIWLEAELRRLPLVVH